jgi:hypothetical protein
MATPFPFTSGQVLTAAQMNAITTLPINDQTASYTLVVGDVGKRVIMNVASANTVTVNNSIFAAGDTIFIANKGAGTSTVTAGAGVTINVNGSLALTQHGGGTLVALSASTFTFFPGSVKNTLSVDFLLVGGGGGGGRYGAGNAGGGGGGGGFVTGSGIIGKTTYTVKVGAAGAGTSGNIQPGYNGTASAFINAANGGGGGGSERAQIGGSGGGGGTNGAGATGVSGEGNNGGNGVSQAGGGGGGASAVGSAGSSTTGGAGGNGSTNNYDGSTTTYAGGGGGGATGAGGAGGTGGGGAGGTGGGTAGTANTGGGGGGGGGAGNGASGGSGVVIVRWLTADAAGLSISVTGTTTNGTDGSFTWYKWTATGTLVIA